MFLIFTGVRLAVVRNNYFAILHAVLKVILRAPQNGCNELEQFTYSLENVHMYLTIYPQEHRKSFKPLFPNILLKRKIHFSSHSTFID